MCEKSFIEGEAFAFTEGSANKFWRNVDKTPGQGPNGDCWFWKRSRKNQKYGQVNFAGRILLSHRVSFAMANGVMPRRGLDVRHRCHQPQCVNPSHLCVGTRKENEADKSAAGRRPRGAQTHMAKFTASQVKSFREEWSTTPISIRKMAQREGVARWTMSEIVHNLTYVDPEYQPPEKDARRGKR